MVGVHYVRTFSKSEEKKHVRHFVAGILLVLAAYILGSLAIDSGSYWQYAGTVVAFGFGVKYLFSAIRHTRSRRK